MDDGPDIEPREAALAAAARRGAQAGELFDLELRRAEARERESWRSGRDLCPRGPRIEAGSYGELVEQSLIRELRARVDRLSAFEQAVLMSRSWKWTQLIRRRLGRT